LPAHPPPLAPPLLGKQVQEPIVDFIQFSHGAVWGGAVWSALPAAHWTDKIAHDQIASVGLCRVRRGAEVSSHVGLHVFQVAWPVPSVRALVYLQINVDRFEEWSGCFPRAWSMGKHAPIFFSFISIRSTKANG